MNKPFNPFDTIVDIPVGYGRKANGQIVRKTPKLKGKKAVKQNKKFRRMLREIKPSSSVLTTDTPDESQ